MKGIRSFLGQASFIEDLSKIFSRIAKPLCNLLVKDTPFEFDEECLKALNILKNKLIFASAIIAPKWIQDFEIMSDANICAIRVVVMSLLKIT